MSLQADFKVSTVLCEDSNEDGSHSNVLWYESTGA
jgi:hypothetical protein